MGPQMNQPLTGILLISLLAVLLGLTIIILFPKLESVRSTGSLRPEVERLGDVMDEGKVQAVEGEGEARPLDVALRLLEPDERRVVEALKDSGGEMLQKDISYDLDLSRVKTHRILVKLLKRGVVTAEKYYNTNRIELADWLMESQKP